MSLEKDVTAIKTLVEQEDIFHTGDAGQLNTRAEYKSREEELARVKEHQIGTEFKERFGRMLDELGFTEEGTVPSWWRRYGAECYISRKRPDGANIRISTYRGSDIGAPVQLIWVDGASGGTIRTIRPKSLQRTSYSTSDPIIKQRIETELVPYLKGEEEGWKDEKIQVSTRKKECRSCGREFPSKTKFFALPYGVGSMFICKDCAQKAAKFLSESIMVNV